MNKIFCYEINEVPWTVIDFYLSKRDNTALEKLLARSHQFTSQTVDSGELHPWSTWPTVHRGVSNDVHKIHFLNQDLSSAEKWPPVWELLSDAGVSVGIFGSLQSYPPSEHENILFHIPDTFAAGPETIPKKYQPFQSFNLKQTGENSAVTSSVGAKDAVDALSLFSCGIRPTSFGKVASHLAKEQINKLHKKRRTLLQPVLAFDLLMDCLKRHNPQFVTFFSNHVAGIMHRYWKYSFPEDFNYELNDSPEDQFHAQSLLVAMDLLDDQLATLIKVCEKHNYEIMLCSSMGQEAIERGEYTPELRMKNFDKFKQRLNLDLDFSLNLAMQPDVAFEFSNESELAEFQETVAKITDDDGERILSQRLESAGCTLNLQLARSPSVAKSKKLLYDKQEYDVDDFGLELIVRDIGTGYHQPEGIWTWQQNCELHDQQRKTVDSRSFAPTLLTHFGVDRPEYMKPPLTLP